MKVRFTTAVLCMVILANLVHAEEKAEFKTPTEKLSYALGMNIGAKLGGDALDVDIDIIARGIRDVLDGTGTMSPEEARGIIVAAQQEIRSKQKEQNKNEGEAFLARNADKEGIVTLKSGLQYKIISEGKGKSPKETDTVTVNYRGTLIDGTEFDSSYKEGKPAEFPLNKVIKGWSEALQLMKEGATWQIFIPAELAYGENGKKGIQPNEVLIFEVELLSFSR